MKEDDDEEVQEEDYDESDEEKEHEGIFLFYKVMTKKNKTMNVYRKL